ncbi:hypothetical protein AJ87_24790 [Rhizobium yanglingense]|nr:hypothetical protein AJ87_24790 [Rhizobium yanglingense]
MTVFTLTSRRTTSLPKSAPWHDAHVWRDPGHVLARYVLRSCFPPTLDAKGKKNWKACSRG